MTNRALLLAGLGLLQLAAGVDRLEAQAISRYTTSRQFHGEVHLTATILFAGGTLDVGPGAPASLYAMQLAYDADRFQPVSRWDAGANAITLGLTNQAQGTVGVGTSTQNQVAHIQFSPQADLDLSLQLGAAKSSIDLGGLRLGSLRLETGASQTDVRFSKRNAMRCTEAAFRAGIAELTVRGLGNSHCDHVTFQGGMGSVVLDYSGGWEASATLVATLAVGDLTLKIPRAVGVSITTEQFLASFTPEGFTRQGNRYVSTNNATATRHLDVTLTTSLGGVTVQWMD